MRIVLLCALLIPAGCVSSDPSPADDLAGAAHADLAGTRSVDLAGAAPEDLAGVPPADLGSGADDLATAATAGYTLVYENGFDTLTDLTNSNGQYGSGTVTTSVYATGPGSFRSRPASVSAGIRSEWQSATAAQNPSEGAIEYDVRYDYVVQGQCHSLQWHPETAGGSASPGLWHEGGKLSFIVWTSSTVDKYPTGVTIVKNVWQHFRVEFKFGSAGYLRFFIDGVKKLDQANIQMGDGSGQYLKLGFNGGFDGNVAEAEKSDIYYDNLKIYKKD